MRPFVFLLATSLLLAGCSSSGPKKGKSKLTRYTFEDKDSNSETGEAWEKEADDGPTLIDTTGEPVRLSKWRGQPVVLVFMRGFAGYICPYCATYTAQISTRYQEIKAAGAEVVIVYPTKEDETAQVDAFVAAVDEILADEGEDAIPFTVLLDPGVKVVKKYNLEWDLSRPSTFVLDARGTVTYAYIGKTLDDRPAVDRILAEVRALSPE